MKCIKCQRDIPEGSIFCNYCGKKQTVSAEKRKHVKRGNGTGSVRKRGRTYSAVWTVKQSQLLPDGNFRQFRKEKGGFKTKNEAIQFLENITRTGKEMRVVTLEEVYAEWSKGYESRVSKSTFAGYKAAYKHLEPLFRLNVADIRPIDLQKCIDSCTSGKRTKQMMKVTAGLLFKFAVDSDYASRNIAENLYTGNDETDTHDPFSMDELSRIRRAVGFLPYADYVLFLCYTGFRPGEMLALKKDALHIENNGKRMFIIGGGKTEAGSNRPVTIPPAIREIALNRYRDHPETEYLFPDGAKPMDHEYFREYIFTPLMENLGITGKVPYSCRHTYSNLIKNAPGDTGDKARLMGHTDYTFTQERYQSSALDDLEKITNSLT